MKRALLVIDLQKEFADKNEKYNKILSYIRTSNYDFIVATKFESGNNNFEKRLNWVFTNTPQPLDFKADLVFSKTGYGLKEEQYNCLDKQYHYDIIGCETDACVLKIAMDLFDREFDFSVLQDYVYTNSDLQQDAMNILTRNIGL